MSAPGGVCLLRGVSAPGGCLLPGGDCSRGVTAPGGIYSQGVSAPGGVVVSHHALRQTPSGQNDRHV